MRVFLFALFVLFIFLSCSSSSNYVNLEDPKDVLKTLASTWESEYMENRGSRIKVPEGMVSHLIFNENGTYTVGVKDGIVKQSGKWNFNPVTKMLTMSSGNERASSRILSLSEREFISSGYMTSNNVIMDSTVITYKRF